MNEAEYSKFTKSLASGYKELITHRPEKPLEHFVFHLLSKVPEEMREKDELISSLNTMTKAYLDDSFEFISRPATISNGREIYEFESKSFPQRHIKYLLEGNRVLIFLAGAYYVSAVGEAIGSIAAGPSGAKPVPH